jgi:biopolymer transport protein ExbB/TolQ
MVILINLDDYADFEGAPQSTRSKCADAVPRASCLPLRAASAPARAKETAVNRIHQIIQAILRSPIVWGLAATAAFYALVINVLANIPGIVAEKILRYTTHHPVEYAEVACFLIGVSALIFKALDLSFQNRMFDRPLLPPAPRDGQAVGDCHALLERLYELPGLRQNEYLIRRLREALEYIGHRQSAEGLDDQLKRLADLDGDRAHSDYGLLRLIIWAIPILGFLGTVIGITMALTSLNPESLETSMVEVTKGLGVKFDTTALALSMSIVLMFIFFFVERTENRLLDRVSRRVEAELIGRFPSFQTGGDPQSAGIQRLGQALIQTIEQLVVRQSDLWQASLAMAEQRWAGMADTAGKHLQTTLSAALSESLKTHAQHVAAIEQAAAENNHRHWDQVHRALVQGTESIASVQTSLARQGDVLGRAIQAAGEVTRLEDALNRNLAALAGSKNFEETVVSLAAAIHLLTSRLGDMPGQSREVRLEPARRNNQAA